MPWQAYVADVALEVLPSGLFAYKTVGVSVPRQSGKTTLDGGTMSHRALVIPAGRCWFTMQSAKDAVDWLTNEFWPLLGPLAGEVQLRRMAGSEHVKWRRSGGLIRPFPPTEAGLHSKTSDLVVVDECWKFDLAQGHAIDQAIIPTQATRPNAQTWKVSTAGTAASTWWLGTTERGRAAIEAGRDTGVCYFEWSCGDLDPTDPETWPLFHPAYGRTIGAESMRAALDELGPDGFARAYGNKWVMTVERVIPAGAWALAGEQPADLPAPGMLALGFDVAVDRSDAAIVAAWRDDAGVGHLEVTDQRAGTGWVAGRLAELAARWRPIRISFDEAGPAIDVADAARRADVELEGLKAREYAAACSTLLEALTADPPACRYRPHPALEAAAGNAGRRALGDAWAWGRRQSAGSIAALTAGTVALWAYDHAPHGEFRIW